MERISTIQKTSVITQPVDAVESPLTLIEKLEQKASQYLQYKNDAKTMHDLRYFGGIVTGLAEAIEVIKQHSDWVSVKERLPDDRSLRYELFTQSDDVTLRHRFCHCDDVKKSTDATHWRVAQQPPSEV